MFAPMDVALLVIWFTKTPLPFLVSISSHIEITFKASDFTLVLSSESFVFLLLW